MRFGERLHRFLRHKAMEKLVPELIPDQEYIYQFDDDELRFLMLNILENIDNETLFKVIEGS